LPRNDARSLGQGGAQPGEAETANAANTVEGVYEMIQQQSTIYIVDSDTALLEKLGALMESVRMPVQTYDAVEAFLRDREAAFPGCLISGVRMPQMSGLALQRKLREEDDLIPVIFLTPLGDVRTAVEAMREGAFDFLQTPVNEQYLLDRVHAALQKDRENRQTAVEQRAAAARFQELSPKEEAVLDLMMKGRPSRDIARELGVTGKTVCFHQTNIKKKVNADTSVRLAYLYFARGFHKEWSERGVMSTDEPAGGTSANDSRNRSNPCALLTMRRGT
jgi:FixJ family two-component response regulator